MPYDISVTMATLFYIFCDFKVAQNQAKVPVL